MEKKKDKVLEELKSVKNAGVCGACADFYFNPDKEDSHYYLSEDEAQGVCIHFSKQKIGTISTNRGCQYWKDAAKK